VNSGNIITDNIQAV